MSSEYYCTILKTNRHLTSLCKSTNLKLKESLHLHLTLFVTQSLCFWFWLPTHRRVQSLHGQGRRWRVDVAVGINVRLLGPRVGAGVLHSRLDVHHLDGQVVELLLRRNAVSVQAVLANDRVRVQVGRHPRPWSCHLHVLHRT